MRADHNRIHPARPTHATGARAHSCTSPFRAVPEGIRIKAFVSELKESFEALPKKSYACEMTRTNKGVCYTPGKDVELALESLLKELRTYSKIQLGDYRKVEFNAF